jgi:hypothetical protein
MPSLMQWLKQVEFIFIFSLFLVSFHAGKLILKCNGTNCLHIKSSLYNNYLMFPPKRIFLNMQNAGNFEKL